MSHSIGRFSIRYAGLADGSHSFDFAPDKTFFTEYFPETDILDSKIAIHIDADKQTGMLITNMTLSGAVTVECDRCLDPCQVELNAQQTLIFSSSINNTFSKKEEDSVIEIGEVSENVILDNHIYDFVILSLPLRRVHDDLEGPDSQCNQDVLKELDQLSATVAPDPRWEKLNELKLGN